MKLFLLLFLLIFIQTSYSQDISVKVLDTDFSKGRLIHQQTITLDDAAKFHGHLCDGLAVGFRGLIEAAYKLYPDSIIDRTNTRIVSKSSPCIADIAIYLTGGRYQYNSFYISDSIKYLYIIQRIDNGKVFGVNLKPGIKPSIIDSLGNIATSRKLDACHIDYLKELEISFLQKILLANPSSIFMVEQVKGFEWKSTLVKTFIKTDVINKNKPRCMDN